MRTARVYPNLAYPPFFAHLDLDGAAFPELRIDGFVGGRLALSRSFSADATKDVFLFTADDEAIAGDGIDATRLIFRVADKYGAPRLFAGGIVKFAIEGPGVLVGDNPFSLEESGGAGAVWIKTQPAASGTISVKATHSMLGAKSIVIKVVPELKAPKI